VPYAQVRGKVAGIREGIAGPCAKRSSGIAAPNPMNAAAANPATNLFFRDAPEVRSSILSGSQSPVSYRLTVCEPNPMRSATRSEGMLFVLLVPFASPVRSCMAKV